MKEHTIELALKFPMLSIYISTLTSVLFPKKLQYFIPIIFSLCGAQHEKLAGKAPFRIPGAISLS